MLACCTPVPPLLQQHLTEVHQLVVDALKVPYVANVSQQVGGSEGEARWGSDTLLTSLLCSLLTYNAHTHTHTHTCTCTCTQPVTYGLPPPVTSTPPQTSVPSSTPSGVPETSLPGFVHKRRPSSSEIPQPVGPPITVVQAPEIDVMTSRDYMVSWHVECVLLVSTTQGGGYRVVRYWFALQH